jgi:hypothetical protein
MVSRINLRRPFENFKFWPGDRFCPVQEDTAVPSTLSRRIVAGSPHLPCFKPINPEWRKTFVVRVDCYVNYFGFRFDSGCTTPSFLGLCQKYNMPGIIRQTTPTTKHSDWMVSLPPPDWVAAGAMFPSRTGDVRRILIGESGLTFGAYRRRFRSRPAL